MAPFHRQTVREIILATVFATVVLQGHNADAACLTGQVGQLVEMVCGPAPPLTGNAGESDPFNMTAVGLSVTFTPPNMPLGPANPASHTVDCFYYQNFTRSQPNDWGSLNPSGNPQYLARYSPQMPGTYSFSITNQSRVLTQGCVNVQDDPAYRSFIDVWSASPNLFAFRRPVGATSAAAAAGGDTTPTLRQSRFSHLGGKVGSGDGGVFLGLGINTCWGSESSYQDWWAKIQAHSGNYTRLWLFGSDFQMQTNDMGVGRFDQKAAWRLDVAVRDMAPKYGLRLMLALHSFNAFREKDYFACWPGCNPYSQLVQDPWDFWNDGRCREYTARYMRYLVARYAWSSHVLAWEFFNEVDGVQNYDEATVTSWTDWAAQTIRQYDNYAQHMRTTSFAQPPGSDSMMKLASLEYTQTHVYNTNDLAQSTYQFTLSKVQNYSKPSFVGEFGASSQSPDIQCYDDGQGVGLTNGWLAPFFGGGTAGANTWWWDSYMEHCDGGNLYNFLDQPAKFWQYAQQLLTKFPGLAPLDLSQYQSGSLNLWAIGSDSVVLLFVRNADYNWKSMLNNNYNTPGSVGGVNVTLNNMNTGDATVFFQPVNATDAPSFNPTYDDSTKTLAIPSTHYGLLVALSLN